MSIPRLSSLEMILTFLMTVKGLKDELKREMSKASATKTKLNSSNNWGKFVKRKIWKPTRSKQLEN